MNVTIFQQITTDAALLAIEEDSEKYKGLFVDMSNDPERAYVKDKASDINAILKRLEVERISTNRNNKQSTDSEADLIKSRLEAANEPFTNLIDEWKAKRDVILKAKKARQEAEDLRLEIERDHEFALLMDSQVKSLMRRESKVRQWSKPPSKPSKKLPTINN